MKRRILPGALLLVLLALVLTLPAFAHEAHSLVLVEAVAPTCTADGSTAHWRCEQCGRIFLDAEGELELTDPAQLLLPGGHVWQRQGYLLPTCQEEGYSGDVLCLRCEAVQSRGSRIPANCSCNHFQDLSTVAWYHDEVDFAVNAGLMNGVSVVSFEPEGLMSRAMIVSVLYRMEGQPETLADGSGFCDVPQEQWYAQAVSWAAQAELVSGYGDGCFGPDDSVTRQQLVTIFCRYARYKGLETGLSAPLDGFSDATLVEDYAREAFSWAIAVGLIEGHDDGRLQPEGFAERCQFCAMLRRWFVGAEWTELLYIESSARDVAVWLEGQRVSCAMVRGLTVVPAEDFAAACGLTLVSDAPAVLTGSNEVRLEGATLTVNGAARSAPEAVWLDGELYLPLFALAEALDYPTWIDPKSTTPYITPTARAFVLPEDVNVPVLMYHAVSDDCWGIDELFVSPEKMEQQLAYLVENGYDPIWFSDLAHLEDYDKPVILTFDDGYDDNYTELLPLLKKYNVKATVFVIAGSVGWEHKMNAEQIREMADSGLVSIQSHGWSHEDMDDMDAATLHFELSESKRRLTLLTGRIPSVLCYPTGYYSNLTLRIAEEYYLFGLKMRGGLYNTSDDPYRVSRYYVSRYTSLATFASYVRSAGT